MSGRPSTNPSVYPFGKGYKLGHQGYDVSPKAYYESMQHPSGSPYMRAWQWLRASNKRTVAFVMAGALACELTMDSVFGKVWDSNNKGKQFKDLVGKGVIGNHPILEEDE
ncbi:unnamed protein product [Pedinophyceae sp. YPF-701]|nr:unnamed protein product [Pedinophyceae sp. YPF-701]